jgi:hypothetical protein
MAENVICPICKSEAEAINVGLFDGVGIRCKTHGEFEVADSALAMHKDTEATRWEAALGSAKDRAKATQEPWPRITSYALSAQARRKWRLSSITRAPCRKVIGVRRR